MSKENGELSGVSNHRRRFLAGLAAGGLAVLAGCSDIGGDPTAATPASIQHTDQLHRPWAFRSDGVEVNETATGEFDSGETEVEDEEESSTITSSYTAYDVTWAAMSGGDGSQEQFWGSAMPSSGRDDGSGSAVGRLIGDVGGTMVPAVGLNVTPGPVSFLENARPVDHRLMAVFSQDPEALDGEAPILGSARRLAGEDPLIGGPVACFHKGILDPGVSGENFIAPAGWSDWSENFVAPGAWSDWGENFAYPQAWSEWNDEQGIAPAGWSDWVGRGQLETASIPAPDGESGVQIPGGFGLDLSYTAAMDGVVVPVENLYPEGTNHAIEGDGRTVAVFTGGDTTGEYTGMPAARPFSAGDTLEADFLMAPAANTFELPEEVSDPDGLEDAVPIAEADVERIGETGGGLSVFLDDAGDQHYSLRTKPGEMIADGDTITLEGDGVVAQWPIWNAPENGLIGRVYDDRDVLLFPDDPQAFAEANEGATVVGADEQFAADDLVVAYPVGVAGAVENDRQWTYDSEFIGSESLAFPEANTPSTVNLQSYPAAQYETSATFAGYGNGDEFGAQAVVNFPLDVRVPNDLSDRPTEIWSDRPTPVWNTGRQQEGPYWDEFRQGEDFEGAYWNVSVGALATPDIAEDNPLAGLSLDELLVSEDAGEFREAVGIGGEWVERPQQIATDFDDFWHDSSDEAIFAGLTGSSDDARPTVALVGRLDDGSDVRYQVMALRASAHMPPQRWGELIGNEQYGRLATDLCVGGLLFGLFE